jgi:hypothetical protein
MVQGGLFTNAIQTLEYLGISDVILPFILIFTLVFAVLQKTKILGEDEKNRPRKNFNVVIGFVMAMAVVIPHVTGVYPMGMDVVDIINQALPNVSIVMVAILMALLIIGVFGSKVRLVGEIGGWVVLAAFAIVLFIFGSAAQWWNLPIWLNFMMDSDTQALIVVALVFAILIWFITKEDNPDDKNKKSLGEKLGVLLDEKPKS